MTITTKFLTGFEHGLLVKDPNTNPDSDHIGLYTADEGGGPGSVIAINTNQARSGSRSLEWNAIATGASNRLARDFGTDISRIVLRFAFKVTDNCTYSGILSLWRGSTEKFELAIRGNDIEVSSCGDTTTFNGDAGGSWHWISINLDAGSTPNTMEWTYDGVAQTAHSGSTANAMQTIKLGSHFAVEGGPATYYIDDLIWGTASSGSDLYGDGEILFETVESDGSHNAAANQFDTGDTGGTNLTNASTTAFQMLDEAPPWSGTRSTTDNIRQDVTGTSNYLEVKPPGTGSLDTRTANYVRALVLYSSPSASPADEGGIVVRNSTPTEDNLYGTSAARQDYTETTNNLKGVIVTVPAGGWTPTEVAAIRVRLGYSGDIAPVPTWQAVGFEIDYPPFTPTTYERSAAIGGTGAIASSGIEILPRSAAIGVTGVIASDGFAIAQRAAAIDAGGAVTVTPQAEYQRQVAFGAAGTIATRGEVDTDTVKERSASLTATGAIASAPQRVLRGSAAIGASVQIASDGFTVHIRSTALDAIGNIATAAQRIASRSALINAAGLISVSGAVTLGAATVAPARRELSVSLAFEVELVNGELLRFTPNEPDNQVLISASFQTEIPGGYSAASVEVPLPTLFDRAILLMCPGRIYVYESNRTLHKGRITGIAETGGHVTLEIEGLARSLQDDRTARQVFYDRDFSHWGDTSVEEKLSAIDVDVASPNAPSVVSDDDGGEPALEIAFDGPFDGSDGSPYAAGVYNSPVPIAAIDFAWEKSSSVGSSSFTWQWVILAKNIDNNLGDPPRDESDETGFSSTGSGTLITTGGDKRYGAVLFFAFFTTTTSKHYAIMWKLLAVVGDHGLPLQGAVAYPNTGRGLLLSDIVEYIVTTWSSLELGDIEETTFVIPHASFPDPTTAHEMIESLVVYGGDQLYPMDWGVYESGFFMASPFNYGTVWHVRLDEGAEQTDSGPDVQRLINGVMVTYDDGSGSTHSVGPPDSGADLETVDLENDDDANPVNRDGNRHWELFDAGITSEPGAILIGQLILAERLRQEWRGDVTVKESVRDENGNWHPVAVMRAGDRLIIEDDPDLDFRERRIVNTSHEGINTACSIGTRPDRLDALLARLGVVLQGRLP